MNKDEINDALLKFSSEHGIRGKGPLSVVLILTRRAAQMETPLRQEDFLTPKGGQVSGLGGGAVQSILADHGITRVLSEEGGRTSRGSIDRMQAYISLLNKLAEADILDYGCIETWWVDRVREHFASQPLKLKVDASKSLRALVAELIEAAFERQRECPGTMVAGAVLQYLVGAKLSVVLPDVKLDFEGFSVADAPNRRKGDFIVNDTVLHVTTAPTEALIRKCQANLADNLRPLIITTESGVGGVRAQAKNTGISDRVDVLDIEQFIATNVYEWSAFSHSSRPSSINDLIIAYNKVIELCETDHSLKIELG
jgi:hypothetical protein